ncbi:MAG: hypothetical protein ACFE9D_00980 [Promethearchaeota archaeon]
MNQRSTGELWQILHQCDFVSLPTRGDGTQVAVRNHEHQGVVCCDLLVYREFNGAGKALQKEVTALVETLSHLQTTLPSNPQSLHSTFQSHTISLFGKKAHVLATPNGHMVHCQMTAVLINQSDDFIPSVSDRASASPAHIIHHSQLDAFLAQHLPTHLSQHPGPSSTIHHLRTSYQMFGLAFLLIPVIIGFTGISISLGLLPLALLTGLLGVLGCVLLLRKARGAFTQFQLHNSIFVQTVQLQTLQTTQPIQTEVALEMAPQQEITQPVSSPTTLWSTANRFLYLHDSMEKAMHDALAAYQAENWPLFSEGVRAFLINGLQVSILKRTSAVPPDNLSEILEQIPSNETQRSLRGWVHRLAETRQNRPLTANEAQHLMNYSVRLLRQQHAIPPTWEIQIFQIVPRLNTITIPVVQEPNQSVNQAQQKRKTKSAVIREQG